MLGLWVVSTLPLDGCFNCRCGSHIEMLSDVTHGLKGESSNDWVFEISKS